MPPKLPESERLVETYQFAVSAAMKERIENIPRKMDLPGKIRIECERILTEMEEIRK